MRDMGEVRRLGDLRLRQPPPLVGLRRRMVELEDAQSVGGLKPVGEGVEARAEHHNLPDAFVNRAPRRVLREAAAHRDEQAQRSPFRPFRGERERCFGVWSQDRERKRIGEDEAPLDDLVSGPVSRGADGGSTCLSVQHGAKVRARGRQVERDEA